MRANEPIVLLDVMMPKLDGISVLEPRDAQRFSSSGGQSVRIVNGLEAGGDYLTKLFEQAALVARIDRCCGSRTFTIWCNCKRSS